MAPKLKAINLVFGQTRWVLNMNDLYLNEKLKVKNPQTCLYQEVHFHNFFGSHKLFLIVECWFCSCCFSMTSILGAKYLGFFSSGSLKMREKGISLAQIVYFWWEVCLSFNFWMIKLKSKRTSLKNIQAERN
jgi:hypothetical protein